eukprot:1147425-Pelagomonas_calceolata.AAC.3
MFTFSQAQALTLKAFARIPRPLIVLIGKEQDNKQKGAGALWELRARVAYRVQEMCGAWASSGQCGLDRTAACQLSMHETAEQEGGGGGSVHAQRVRLRTYGREFCVQK